MLFDFFFSNCVALCALDSFLCLFALCSLFLCFDPPLVELLYVGGWGEKNVGACGCRFIASGG